MFANRCPLVQDVCRKETPPLVDIGSGHRTACFFSDEVPAATHLTDDAA